MSDELMLGQTKKVDFACFFISSLIFLAAVFNITSSPMSVWWLIPLCLYFLLVVYRPYCVFVILPISIVLIDSKSWIGFSVFNEFDSLIWLTVAAGILHFKNKIQFLVNHSPIFLVIFLALVFINVGLQGGFGSFVTETNPYYDNSYSVFIAKGIVYGALLAILFVTDYFYYPEETKMSWFYGAATSAFLLFIIVLWERGTLLALFEGNTWWHGVSSLLNFSGSYRVTGFFAEMHTGGEAFDGIVLFLLAVNLFAFLNARQMWQKNVYLLACFAVTYCVLVGYTRATYLAAFVLVGSLVVFWQLKVVPRRQRFTLAEVIQSSCLCICSVLILKYSGFASLTLHLVLLIVFPLLMFISKNLNLNRLSSNFLYTLIWFIVLLFSYVQQSESKWFDNTFSFHNRLFILSFIFFGILLFLHKNLTAKLSATLLRNIVMVVISSVLSVGSVGYQINARLDHVERDFMTRVFHWQSVIQSGDWLTSQWLFGHGVGSFPKNYALTFPEEIKKIGSFEIKDSKLNIGIGEDLTIGQRIKVESGKRYLLTGHFSAEEQAKLLVGICYRNILYPTNFAPNCNYRLIASNTLSHKFSVDLYSPEYKTSGNSLLQWPAFFVVKNISDHQIISINWLKLVGSDKTTDLLKNGDFSNNLENWYFYNDYNHLPWHIKNIYLSFVYQLGLIGVLLLLILIFQALWKRHSDPFIAFYQYTLVSLLLALCAFGMFGDPFDSPKASTLLSLHLFSCVLFTVIYKPQKRLFNVSKVQVVTFFSVIVILLGSLHFGLKYYLQMSYLEFVSQKQRVKDGSAYVSTRRDELSIEDWNEYEVGPKLQPLSARHSYSKKLYKVSNVKAFLSRIRAARPGDSIELQPGYYTINGHSIALQTAGTELLPIEITASQAGKVIIEFNLIEGFHISQPYWNINNLIIVGICKVDKLCEHAFHIVGKGHNTKIINNIIKNFNSPFKINQKDGDFPDKGIIKQNAIYNNDARDTATPVTFIDLVSASGWSVENNFVADFAKKGGDHISYGMFFKGAGERNIFKRNLVVCEWRHKGGFRIGTSIGGGGTGAKFCRDLKCDVEQSNSSIINNVVMHCPNDVGLYVNKGKNTLVAQNIFYRTRGIDVRFKESDALLSNNIIDGRVWTRDGGQTQLINNQYSQLNAFLGLSLVEELYQAPWKGDFRVLDMESLMMSEPTNKESNDFCQVQPMNRRSIGPFEIFIDPPCQPNFKFIRQD